MPKSKKPKAGKKKAASKKSYYKLSWLPQKTFELEITIPKDQVTKLYQQVLQDSAQQVEIKGFRKGKAPMPLVEKSLGKEKIFQKVIEKVIPEHYIQAVKQHNLRPIINPQITPVSLQPDQDWVVKAVSAEAPQIKLGNYQQAVKGASRKQALWVPGKDDPKQKDKKPSYDQKINTVTKALLEAIPVEIPQILIDQEVNRMLSRLLDQVNQLGLTIQQYLESKGLTNQILRQNFARQARETLSLEFILQAIVKDRNFKVKKEEVDKMIAASGDEKIKKKLDTPSERAYIASILAKRKALDYLAGL